MAKKQTRRSISVSRMTYERLKSFCEANNISMSQLVETQVNGFLGDSPTATVTVVPTSTHMIPTHSAVLGSTSSAPVAPRAPMAAPIPQRANLASLGPAPRSVTAAVTGSIGSVGSMGSMGSGAAPVAARTSPVVHATHATPAPVAAAIAQQVPMTSAAVRIAVEPPPPIIKPRQETAAPKPPEKRADQIFTF